MAKPDIFSSELDIIRGKILIGLAIYVFFCLFFFFFTVIPIPVILPGNFRTSLPLPIPELIPTSNTLSIAFLKQIQMGLLGRNVELISINPLDLVVAQISISMFLGIIFSFPFNLYLFISYIFPALKKREKKVFLYFIFPSMVLFSSGCLFSYYFFLPLTFRLLFGYVAASSVKPYFEISRFVSLSILITLICGLVFQLPLFMSGLSIVGIVRPEIWVKNWRTVILSFIIFAAFISPDNTGITAILITFILAFLYAFGYYGSRIFSIKFTAKGNKHVRRS